MQDETFARTLITIDGHEAVRLHDGRVMVLPSGGDGTDETPPPADATAADELPPAVAEGAPAEPAPIPDLPADIEAADEGDLRALYGQFEETHAARREAGVTGTAQLDELRAIRDRQNAIAGELTRRRDEASQVAEQLAAMDAEQPAPLPEVPAMASVSAAAVAAARGSQPLVAQRPSTPASPPRPVVPMLASAAGEGVAAGDEITMAQLGQLFHRYENAKAPVILASLPAFEDGTVVERGDMLHSDNGANRNDAIIEQAVADWRARRAGTAPRAMTAAICDPLDIIREIPDAFDASEPVAAIFPSRPAGRLGYQFTPSLILADIAAGVTLWDEADQAAVNVADSGTWKPCVVVTCPSVQTVRAEAVPGCLSFDNTTEMSNPARITNATNALNAVRARTKEGRLLQLIDNNSSKYRVPAAGTDYGALPAVIEAINTVIAQVVYANRLDNPDYVLILPPAVVAILTIDRANRAYGREEDAVTQVLSYLESNLDGVSRVVRTLDASLGGEPGIPFPALPLSTVAGGPLGLTSLPAIEGGDYRLRLVDPAAAIYATTGQMNVGVTRDSNQLRQNRAQYFVEDYFMFAKHGPQPWATIDMILCGDGARAGLVTPDACATS